MITGQHGTGNTTYPCCVVASWLWTGCAKDNEPQVLNALSPTHECFRSTFRTGICCLSKLRDSQQVAEFKAWKKQHGSTQPAIDTAGPSTSVGPIPTGMGVGGSTRLRNNDDGTKTVIAHVDKAASLKECVYVSRMLSRRPEARITKRIVGLENRWISIQERDALISTHI